MSEPMTFQKKSRRERYIVRDDVVPVAGVEPAPCCQDWILSPARLPIPSHRPIRDSLYIIQKLQSRIKRQLKKSKISEEDSSEILPFIFACTII